MLWLQKWNKTYLAVLLGYETIIWHHHSQNLGFCYVLMPAHCEPMVFLSKVASFIINSSIYAWIILWLNTIIMKLYIMFFGLCHPLTRILCIFVTYFTRGIFFIKKLPTHISFKASLIWMAFSYLKSVAYIREVTKMQKILVKAQRTWCIISWLLYSTREWSRHILKN